MAKGPRCPNCGAVNGERALRCRICTTHLTPAAHTPAAPPPPPPQMAGSRTGAIDWSAPPPFVVEPEASPAPPPSDPDAPIDWAAPPPFVVPPDVTAAPGTPPPPTASNPAAAWTPEHFAPAPPPPAAAPPAYTHASAVSHARRGPSAGVVLRVLLAVGVGVAAFVGVAALVAPAKKAPPIAEWISFTDPSGTFTVSFPGEPHHKVEKQSTSLGTIPIQLWTSSYSDLQVAVGFADYPVRFAGAAVQAGLQGAANGAAANSNSHLVGGLTFLRVGGNPAADFTLAKGSDTIEARVILNGARIYVLETESKSSIFAEHQKLLDSFRINT